MHRHPTLPPGSRLGPYTLAQPLGSGSSAVVYLARRGERDLAVKVRARGDVELDRRFLREFEAMRTLALPGVVRVHDAGMGEEWLWYAMDLVRGTPIRTWIEGGPGESVLARVDRLLRVAPPLCDAIAAIHRAGLIHRDLKPSNVLVDAAGRAHVLDFGVVRWWGDSDPLTRSGGIVGTLPFMAPEQVAGNALTSKADIFALGLLLYEGIAGKRARPARSQDWLRIQCIDRPRPLATINVAMPLAASHVIERMMALDPGDRPDAGQAAALFRACAAGTAPAEWPAASTYVGDPPAVRAGMDLFRGHGPRVLILAGPSGSGRRRACEQIRRRALLAGLRTVRGRCRVERSGAALGELLDALLEAPADEAWRRQVGGGDTAALLEMWPHLPLQSSDPGAAALEDDVVSACAAALERAAGEDGLLLAIEDLDEVDRLTGRVLTHLARAAPDRLSIVCTLDDRFASHRAARLVATLVEAGHARRESVPDLTAEEATALARSLVPEGDAVEGEAGSPRLASEAGLATLARLRGIPGGALPAAAFPAALEARPLSRAAWTALGVVPDRLAASGLLKESSPGSFAIRDDALRASALARLGNRAAEARRLADLWAADASPERHAARARALLLAEDAASAFEPAVLAALEAEQRGRYREARDWLLLIDVLPRERDSAAYRQLRPSLAWCRAAVVARTGSERARPDLVNQAVERAVTREDRIRASLLHADILRRKGDLRGALVTCMRQADHFAHVRPLPPLAVEALAQAAELRLEMGQVPEALAHLDAAESERGGRRSDIEQLRLDEVRAEALVTAGAPAAAATLAEEALRLAGALRSDRGVGALHLSLGRARLFLGDRPRAEASAIAARRLFVGTGERAAAAVAALHLGTLAIGRGDPSAAWLHAQEALTSARRLNLVQLRIQALTLTLEIATVRADAELAERCLAETEGLGARPPAFAIAELRWWRSIGEYDRALLAADPGAEPGGATGYRAAEMELEVARLRVSCGDGHRAGPHLAHGEDIASAGAFPELLLYARVLRGSVDPPTRTDGWALTFAEASRARWVELFLYVLLVDARRRVQKGDAPGARTRFLELDARAEEHGHRPYVAAARAALGE